MNRPDSVLRSGLLAVGKVLGPQGVKGLLRIKIYSGSAEPFVDTKTAFFQLVSGELREHAVISCRPHAAVHLMKVEELNSLDGAEAYKAAEILLRKDTLVREAGVYFHYELVGVSVHTDTGEYVGDISRIIETGANDIYVVTQGEKEILIPAVADVVKEIDLKNNKITISPMEGLLDLNEV